MILATTPSGNKLKPAAVLPNRSFRAEKAFAHLLPHCYFMWGHRWCGEERWIQYIDEVIAPYCEGRPATFIVDSSPVHLIDCCVIFAMDHDIVCVQAPPGMTADLQPHDVLDQVYGPLTSVARSAWLSELRGEPEVYDNVPQAIEHYLR